MVLGVTLYLPRKTTQVIRGDSRDNGQGVSVLLSPNTNRDVFHTSASAKCPAPNFEKDLSTRGLLPYKTLNFNL